MMRTHVVPGVVVDPRLASWVAATGPPPSYEAYQLFAQGFDAYSGARFFGGPSERTGFLTAADYFRQAAALNSTYALPLLWEVYARSHGGDRDGVASILDDLTSRRDALTRWEQNLLDAHLARREDDRLKQYAALSRLVAMRPGSEWNIELAQVAGSALGRLEEAVTLLEGVTDQGWLAVWPQYWWLLTEFRHMLGQYQRELQDVGTWRVRFPEYVWVAAEIAPLAALGRVEEALGLAQAPADFAILVSELFAHGYHEAAQGVITKHLPRVDFIDPSPFYDAQLLLWTGRLAEAESLLRSSLEERPYLWEDWALLVKVILAKGDREEAVRIANQVVELETTAPGLKAVGRVLTLMHLGDRAGAVTLLRPMFAGGGWSVYFLRVIHRFGPVPQSMADYAPFRELVGWPPPAPN